MSNVPIADHALLSDCDSATLVSRHGSVDWLCFPRFDSPSIFGRLLDGAAGRWSITPTGAFETSRRYLDATMCWRRPSEPVAGQFASSARSRSAPTKAGMRSVPAPRTC